MAASNHYQAIKANRQAILQLAAKHGAYNIRVFGSAVRGQDKPQSDVDFLVNVKPEHSAWFPAGLMLELQALLGIKVDVVTEEALHWYLREQILREAIPL